MKEEYIVKTESPVRLDKYLSGVSDLSRTRIKELAEAEQILVNEKVAKPSYKLEGGEVITIDVPEDVEPEITGEDIPLDILYEDSDIIVVNKPKGMVVHPSPGHYSGTLVNALLFHCKDLSGINGVKRPGIVHRIDKDTTGCIVACKNDHAHEAIAAQLADKTCHREYKAIVDGVIASEYGVIDAPIGRDPRNRQKMTVIETNSKSAKTHFHVLERFVNHTFVDCTLETGRTHQIRVHMKYIQHPVTGDEVYGKKCALMDTHGQVLHAYRLTLVHPVTQKTMTFEAPLPDYFKELLELLRKDDHS